MNSDSYHRMLRTVLQDAFFVSARPNKCLVAGVEETFSNFQLGQKLLDETWIQFRLLRTPGSSVEPRQNLASNASSLFRISQIACYDQYFRPGKRDRLLADLTGSQRRCRQGQHNSGRTPQSWQIETIAVDCEGRAADELCIVGQHWVFLLI